MRNEYPPSPPVDWHQPIRSPDGTVVQSWLRTSETLPNLLRARPGTYHHYQGRCLAAALREDYVAEGRSELPHVAHGGQEPGASTASAPCASVLPTCVECRQRLEQACGAGTGCPRCHGFLCRRCAEDHLNAASCPQPWTPPPREALEALDASPSGKTPELHEGRGQVGSSCQETLKVLQGGYSGLRARYPLRGDPPTGGAAGWSSDSGISSPPNRPTSDDSGSGPVQQNPIGPLLLGVSAAAHSSPGNLRVVRQHLPSGAQGQTRAGETSPQRQ